MLAVNTSEVAHRAAAGQKIEPKTTIVGERGIGKGKDVARLVNDESLGYYRLYIGQKETLDAADADVVFRPRGLTICDKQELQALKSIFTGEKVNNILNGNGNRNKIVDEIELEGFLETEKTPRVARLVKGSSDFYFQIGEKKVLDSEAKWAPRSITIYKNELPALKKLFENLGMDSFSKVTAEV